MSAGTVRSRKVRYGVVGGGWISQAAFMPSMAQTGNSELAAFVTGDAEKAEAVRALYGIGRTCGYDGFPHLLASGDVDAIYLALPNRMHREFAVAALEAGIHVLLEKPMATSEEECRAIIAAAGASGAKLMIAYRLHFEAATLEAVRLVRAGEIGDPRLFSSVMTQRVSTDNHKARGGFWAGPVADMGPYPINVARSLFGTEPVEVMALGTRNPDLAFDFHDTVSMTLRFPGERLAQITVSYGASSADQYRMVGTQGDLEVAPGFALTSPLRHRLRAGERRSDREFPRCDQFSGQVRYFSDCILGDRDPEPDGEEGWADMRVIAAVERALETGQRQGLEPMTRSRQLDPAQGITLPPVSRPHLANAAAPGER